MLRRCTFLSCANILTKIWNVEPDTNSDDDGDPPSLKSVHAGLLQARASFEGMGWPSLKPFCLFQNQKPVHIST